MGVCAGVMSTHKRNRESTSSSSSSSSSSTPSTPQPSQKKARSGKGAKANKAGKKEPKAPVEIAQSPEPHKPPDCLNQPGWKEASTEYRIQFCFPGAFSDAADDSKDAGKDASHTELLEKHCMRGSLARRTQRGSVLTC
jgi:cell division protein FtsN